MSDKMNDEVAMEPLVKLYSGEDYTGEVGTLDDVKFELEAVSGAKPLEWVDSKRDRHGVKSILVVPTESVSTDVQVTVVKNGCEPYLQEVHAMHSHRFGHAASWAYVGASQDNLELTLGRPSIANHEVIWQLTLKGSPPITLVVKIRRA